MDRLIVSTDRAPAAVGPYSQAVIAGDLVFTAGAIALDPDTGELVGDDVTEQTGQVIRNLESILEEAGSSLYQVVKTTVFLTDMKNFAEMNAVYSEFFGENPPARSTVEVGPLARGALVEIEAIAVR
ncbi:MAG: reactive intermediate/imine deaminase [Anaerolineae bacterium]|nr:reactive intermediate/imine deaminase [Anaerolineae bacterium]NIQ82132.1 reactive intermediate/imine deaminase [Anaerolineae bacterium]